MAKKTVLISYLLPQKVSVQNIQITKMAGTDRTYFASWNKLTVSLPKNNQTGKAKVQACSGYEYRWGYYPSNSSKPIMDNSWTSVGRDIVRATYDPSDPAIKIVFEIRPLSKSYTTTVNKKKKTSKYFTPVTERVSLAVPTSEQAVPTKPSAPTVTAENFVLKAVINNLAASIKTVRFQVVRDNSTVSVDQSVSTKYGQAVLQVSYSAGHTYKCRIKVSNAYGTSDWSDYSADTTAIPTAITSFTTLKAVSYNSVRIDWPAVAYADSYEVEYTTDYSYFDRTSVSSATTETNSIIITGLDPGETYYFRARAVNDNSYKSKWYPTDSSASIKIGRPPAPPTTYSSFSSIKVGEKIRLYWVHNSQDSSSQTEAKIELKFYSTTLGTLTDEVTIQNPYYDDELRRDETLYFEINTANTYVARTGGFTFDFTDGVSIEWRVQTKGIIDTYGEWSVIRKIDIYAPPTLIIFASSETSEWIWDPFDLTNGNTNTSIRIPETTEDPIFTKYPIAISLESGPTTQTPIGYYLEIVANEDYTYEDVFGELHNVGENEVIYSTYFNDDKHSTYKMLQAFDTTLHSSVSYTIRGKVTMNSGLTAEAEFIFEVEWEDQDMFPDMGIVVDEDTLTAAINPYCLTGDLMSQEIDDDEEVEPVPGEEENYLVEDVVLSVYRKNADGEFIEIASQIDNTGSVYVIDPHPTLNYVLYRVVATSLITGAQVYSDSLAIPVDQPGVVINWDEEVKTIPALDIPEDDMVLEDLGYNGSMLILPYNVNVSEKHGRDVELVKYIGRKRPVSYYGTQLDESATWTTECPITDEATLESLRKLSNYIGDVYVRESNSRSGYWANIEVSFNDDHCAVVVPISLTLQRVEGGA